MVSVAVQICVPLLSRLGPYLHSSFLEIFLIRLHDLPKLVCVLSPVEQLLFSLDFCILKTSLMEGYFKTFCSCCGKVNVVTSTCIFMFLIVGLWDVVALTIHVAQIWLCV